MSRAALATAIYTRSLHDARPILLQYLDRAAGRPGAQEERFGITLEGRSALAQRIPVLVGAGGTERAFAATSSLLICLTLDRKSTRLNSSHPSISYAVLCLQNRNA